VAAILVLLIAGLLYWWWRRRSAAGLTEVNSNPDFNNGVAYSAVPEMRGGGGRGVGGGAVAAGLIASQQSSPNLVGEYVDDHPVALRPGSMIQQQNFAYNPTTTPDIFNASTNRPPTRINGANGTPAPPYFPSNTPTPPLPARYPQQQQEQFMTESGILHPEAFQTRGYAPDVHDTMEPQRLPTPAPPMLGNRVIMLDD
jgi:hypothetical protein